MTRWILAALIFPLTMTTACRRDLSGHWVGEACTEGSGYDMDFRLELTRSKATKDRIWAGSGTLVHPCEPSSNSWMLEDSVEVCELTYEVSAKHHDEDGFTGVIWFGFGACAIPADDIEFDGICPHYMWDTILNTDAMEGNLAIGMTTPEGDFVHKHCEVWLSRDA